MTASAASTQVLDPHTLSFIQLYVSMNLATRNQELKPAVTRAFGCRASADLKSVTLFISSQCNQTVLENIQTTRAIAAVFSRPSTHETIQLKAKDARVVMITAEDHPTINSYRQSLIHELQSLGYPASFTESMVPPLAQLDTGICFTPDSVFIQTPGPQAGKKLTP